ncbi:hypothetical protein [Mucilaginibacter sp. dw_454]|uniref:hypothetical protein n=1 Tax=Mucilaginibacter sp. dw_454 TaxID=2720079 RepID=UPI001BD57C6B|nr:hypothetical protein [Mucilaginibacter sp. dw_454]
MKKPLVFICLFLLTMAAIAQNVKTLKYQADSLRKKTEYQKAEPLYNEAINQVLTYQEKLTNQQWVELSLAAQQNHIKAYNYTDDKTATYANWEYSPTGPKLKEKINDLIRQTSSLVFTYGAYGGGTVNTYIVNDSISHTQTGYTPSYRQILVWVTDDAVFMQAFSDANIYEPIKIGNKALIKFLRLHQDELPIQAIERVHSKSSESSFYVFEFYTIDNVWTKRIYNAYDTTDSKINSNTALYQLLPLIQEQVKMYDDR